MFDHIAALAGVGRSSVKNALREAHGLGLVRIEERRLTGFRNDTNVVNDPLTRVDELAAPAPWGRGQNRNRHD
jgi:DNA-binding FadR family transcriptional regulator